MVLTSQLRNAAKRIPMIKFRAGGNKHQSSGPAAASVGQPSSAPQGSQQIEDWQLPNRYRRLPLDDKEIDAINSGGAY